MEHITSLGVQAAAFQADFTTYDAVRKLHADVLSKLGHPDILFNNAGLTGSRIGPMGNIQDVTPEEFEHTWKANTGTHYLVRTYIYLLPITANKELTADSALFTTHAISEIWKDHLLLEVMMHSVSRIDIEISHSNSVAANTGGIIGPHYASSKSAMHGLMHWIASRYAKEGIVSPFWNTMWFYLSNMGRLAMPSPRV